MKKTRSLIGVIFIILVAIFALFYGPEDLKTSIKDTKDTFLEKDIKTNGELEVYFIDVGQGDSILIKEKDKTMLIDAGNNEDGALLVDYFKELGISKFDYIIGTHPHEDHIGGLDNVINEFDVDKIYMPKVSTTTITFEEVLDAIRNKGLTVSTPDIGYEFNLDNADIKVLHVNNDVKDLNDASIVLKLTFGNNSFLFMGDAPKKVEKSILNQNIKADVLKVGHHGSEYSSSMEFLKNVSPTYAIISCGKNNIYKHPKDITLENLESLDVSIYRTDELGTIKTISDGKNIKISYEKTNTNG